MHFHNPIFRHYLILAVGFLSLFIVAITSSESLSIFLIVIWWVLIAIAMFVSGKCPNCRKPIILVRWFSGFSKPIFPKNCDNCGASFDQPSGVLENSTKKVSVGTYSDFDRIELVEKPEGVYIFIFKAESSAFPEEDHLQDNMSVALEVCEKDYGVPLNGWKEVAF